jgi:hypothetical protein
LEKGMDTPALLVYLKAGVTEFPSKKHKKWEYTRGNIGIVAAEVTVFLVKRVLLQ